MTSESFRVEGIDHVELTVPDRREAAAWYERVLGLSVLEGYAFWAEEGGPLMVSSDDGATKLALFAGDPTAGERGPFHRVAFRVSGEGFLAFLDRLEREAVLDGSGERVDRSAVVDHDVSFSIYFRDPYEHPLEVTTYDHDVVARAR